MEHILEELFYGNLNANCHRYCPGSHAAACLEKLNILESRLIGNFSDDAKYDRQTMVNTCSDNAPF